MATEKLKLYNAKQIEQIEQVKQLTYEEIEEHACKSREQKHIKRLNNIADEVALRISKYMDGEYYHPYYEVDEFYFSEKILEEHLNSVFNSGFRVQSLTKGYSIRLKADVPANASGSQNTPEPVDKRAKWFQKPTKK